MNRTSSVHGLFLTLLLVFAALFAFTPIGGMDGGSIVAKSVTEPLHLLRVLFLEVAPANLVVIAFVGCVLLDSFALARRMPPAAGRVFEQATMLILSGVLCGQYLKLSGLASTIPNASTAAILGAFGLAAIGFASILTIKVRRYLALRAEILGLIHAGERESVRSQFAAHNPSRIRVGVGIGAVFVVGLIVAFYSRTATTSPEDENFAAKETGKASVEAKKNHAEAVPQPVRVQQESIQRISVGAQAKRGDGAAAETGEASLPSGLRFSWAGGGQGYEPAFLKRARDGNYYWRGQRVPANAPILAAFALDGPAVRPDGENALLFFHRDVLARIHGALAGQMSADARPNIAVDRDGGDVVLRITGVGHEPRTIIVSPATL